jgi:hypothetical protein
LIEDFKEHDKQLKNFAILPQKFNDEEKTISFLPGVCSLKDLIDHPAFICTEDQAVHVFSTLLDFMLLLKQQGYCHSDMKPANT